MCSGDFIDIFTADFILIFYYILFHTLPYSYIKLWNRVILATLITARIVAVLIIIIIQCVRVIS